MQVNSPWALSWRWWTQAVFRGRSSFGHRQIYDFELVRQDLIQIPVVSGGIAIVVHLPELKGNLRLDGPTLAAIFRGRITRWNDATIVALNPDTALPDVVIEPIHRSDGSGSTYTLTRYLATQDTEWQG